MVEVKKKKKPRGKPFPKGVSGNPTGNPPGKVKAALANRTFAECFIAMMNKEVVASTGSQTVVAPNYEHFLGEMIKAGIKGSGGAASRKLVLEFMNALEVKETAAEAKRETEGEDIEAFSWDAEKEKLYRELKAAGRA